MKTRLTADQRICVEKNLKLVPDLLQTLNLQNRKVNSGSFCTDPEDLRSAGYLGLCKAAGIWNCGNGPEFQTFARRFILHELKAALKADLKRVYRYKKRPCQTTGQKSNGEEQALLTAETRLLYEEFIEYFAKIRPGDGNAVRLMAGGLSVEQTAERIGKSISYVYGVRHRAHRVFLDWIRD